MTPRAAVALVLAGALLAGCTRPNQNPPDQLLRDSLGLEESDQVFRVELRIEEGAERASPGEVTVPPGAFVEFVSRDRLLHTVEFQTDSMATRTADFLRSTGQDGAVPLLEPGSRFVVSFGEAPAGRYPYLLRGNGEPGGGVVVVATAEGG